MSSGHQFAGLIPEMLVRRRREKRCVRFVGAGLSAQVQTGDGSHLSTWKLLLERMIAWGVEHRIRTSNIVVANPMWNRPFPADIPANDPFDRFRAAGGITAGKGGWAWLQHTLACLNKNSRAAVVLDTGTATRGSGLKNEDKERSIRKWFVDNDLVEGVILHPDNLFYNAAAPGIIVDLNKRKAALLKDRIARLNASRHFKKDRPKKHEEPPPSARRDVQQGRAAEGELGAYFHKMGIVPVDGLCSTDIAAIESIDAEYSFFCLGHASGDSFVACASHEQ